jgi:hypothetical protein
MYERGANTALTSSIRSAPQLRAHHAYGVNTDALHLLARAEQIFNTHISGRNRVSPDFYFAATPTQVPRITLAVLTRSGSQTMVVPPATKRVRKQQKKALASPMVDVATVNTPMDQRQPSQQQISALDTSSPSS